MTAQGVTSAPQDCWCDDLDGCDCVDMPLPTDPMYWEGYCDALLGVAALIPEPHATWVREVAMTETARRAAALVATAVQT